MLDTFSTHKKPLKNITHQQNNSHLQNNFTSITKNSKLNSSQNQRLVSKDTAGKRSKKKIEQNSNDKQNRNIKYHQCFQRTPEQTERQEHNCQNYFLRKTIMALYKLFQRMQLRWNLYELNYCQLLKIMQELHYIRLNHSEQINEKTSSDLKKCYWIWVNISQGKRFSLNNLIVILFCIQHLEYDIEIIEEIVKELTKGIEKFQLDCQIQDSKYIFLVKNQRFRYKQGILELTKTEIDKIQLNLKDLKLNRLMQSHRVQNQKQSLQQSISLLSKKSQQLAETKRQKILSQIKQKQPHVQQIQLYHLLSYKANKKERTIKTQSAFVKKEKYNQKEYKKQVYKVNTTPNQSLPQQVKKKISNKLYPQPYKPRSIQKQGRKDKNKLKNGCNNKNIRKKLNHSNKRESIELQFDQFYSQQLKKVNQQDNQPKYQILDQLQWQQIPKIADQMKDELESIQPKDEFTLCQPLSHTFAKHPQEDKQRKRKQYLDLPILFVDVNIEQGKKQRIIIYEGDKASDLALDFGRKHKLNEEMISRLEGLLDLQIGSVLTKIDESNEQDCSELY